MSFTLYWVAEILQVSQSYLQLFTPSMCEVSEENVKHFHHDTEAMERDTRDDSNDRGLILGLSLTINVKSKMTKFLKFCSHSNNGRASLFLFYFNKTLLAFGNYMSLY